MEGVQPDAADLARATRIGLDQRSAPIPTVGLLRGDAVSEKMGVHVGEHCPRRPRCQPAHVRVEPVEHVRRLASGTPRAVLADVYAHFLGHGVAAEDADRWYWRRSLIEPNARGASEVRRVWVDALHAAGALDD